MTATAGHEPLRDPQTDTRRWVPPLDIAITRARETLAEQQAANIYDNDSMLRAAVHLEHALQALLAALDNEAAR